MAERKDGDDYSTCKRNTKDEVKLRTGHSIPAFLLAQVSCLDKKRFGREAVQIPVLSFQQCGNMFSISILFLHARLLLIPPREEMS